MGRLLVSTWLVLSIGCAPVELTPDAHILSVEDLQGALIEPDVLWVPRSAVWLGAVDEGDTLISETGLLRQVVAIDWDVDPVEVRTQPGQLSDAVAGELQLAQNSGNVAGKADVVDVELGIHFIDNEVPVMDIAEFQLTIEEARFDMWPTLDMDVHMDNRRLEELRFAFSSDIEAEVRLRADLSLNESYIDDTIVPLYVGPPRFFVQWAGVVPIVESIRTRLFLEVHVETDSVDAGASVVVGAGANASFGAGFQYVDGELGVIPMENTLDLYPIADVETEVSGHLRVEVALRPEVEVRFYELAGVTVGVEAYGVVDTNFNPLTCDFSAGLRGDVAADLGAFGVGTMWERDLFDEPISDTACF